jgi:hypothetical protein
VKESGVSALALLACISSFRVSIEDESIHCKSPCHC